MRRGPLAVALIGAGIAGCSGDTTAPTLERRVAVHAVLQAFAPEQQVLVEETRIQNGNRDLRMDDPTNPIGATQGMAITDAEVRIIGPTVADTVVARQVASASSGAPRADGVYRLQTVTSLDPSAARPVNTLLLVPGGRYRLEVVTGKGTVTGNTTMPAFTSAPDTRDGEFNLDHDTLRVRAEKPAGTAAFELYHDPGPYIDAGSLALVGLSTRSHRIVPEVPDPLLIPASAGDTAWGFSFAWDWIAPGALQKFHVVAVDSNYLRYYDTGADPFGEGTRGNSLHGGVGLFGSVAPLLARPLELTADIDKPFEGTWVPDAGPTDVPRTIRLYESPHFPKQPYFRYGETSIDMSGYVVMADGARLFVWASFSGQPGSKDFPFAFEGYRFHGSGTATETALDGFFVTSPDQNSSVRAIYRPQ